MTEAYRALAGRIRRDLDDVRTIADRAQTIWQRYEETEDPYYVDAAALNLHDVYVGLERLFEEIAREVDRSVPEGPHWHRTLLDQMASSISSTRPAVLSNEVRQKLGAYRGFRHVVRNVYAVEFDPEQVAPLMRRLPDVCDAVIGELDAFADTLERIADDDS
jgi:hypothetical protein